MGDYRNEFQSALSQVEALRAENAGLRVKLRAAESGAARGDAPDVPPPAVETAATPLRVPRHRRRVFAGVTLGVGCAAFMLAALVIRPAREAPPEERLLLPNLPEVPVVGASHAPLPLPPTSVQLPPRQRPEASVEEIRDSWIPHEPVAIEAGRAMGLRWPSEGRQGLYVLHTVPASQCSVGGVLFEAPSAVYVTEGTHQVRCQVGRVRHVWEVTIASRRVTFDTQHYVGSR